MSSAIYKDYKKTTLSLEGVFQVYLDDTPFVLNGNNMYYLFNQHGLVMMGYDINEVSFLNNLSEGLNTKSIKSGTYTSHKTHVSLDIEDSSKKVNYTYDTLSKTLLNENMKIKWVSDLEYSNNMKKNHQNTNKLLQKTTTKNYCSLTLAETFTFLTDNSPFNLGSTGSVNFTKRFDYGRNAWVEGEINISGGMGSNSRLSGQYRVTNRNTLKVSGLKATGGRFDASRNGDTYGSFTINCDGNIEGYLRDYKGNSRDILIKKH